MIRRYKWSTKVGDFYLAELQGRWHVVYNDESLGAYVNAVQALDDLVGGHTFSAGPNIDTATLGIPDEISEWEECYPRQ